LSIYLRLLIIAFTYFKSPVAKNEAQFKSLNAALIFIFEYSLSMFDLIIFENKILYSDLLIVLNLESS